MCFDDWSVADRTRLMRRSFKAAYSRRGTVMCCHDYNHCNRIAHRARYVGDGCVVGVNTEWSAMDNLNVDRVMYG